MRSAAHESDATVEWMSADIAQRCREALDVLQDRHVSTVQLGSAAMLLRSAADDLVSLLSLVGEPGPGTETASTTLPAFGLSFAATQDERRSTAMLLDTTVADRQDVG